MNYKNFSLYIRLAYVLLDVFFIAISAYLATVIREGTFPFHNIEPITWHNLFWNKENPFHYVYLGWLVAVPFYNGLHNLYQTRREVLEAIELWGVLKSVFLAVVTLVTMMFALKITDFPRTVFALIIILVTVFLCVWRVAKRQFVEFLAAHGYNNFNVLIIGAGRVGQALAAEINAHPGAGLKVAGFLDDFKTDKDLEGHGKILGKINEFRHICRREFINKIFITIHHDSGVFLGLLQQARHFGIAVRVVPQGFDQTTGEMFKYNIGFIPVLEYTDIQNKRRQIGKRLFDLIVAIIGLVAISPLLLIISCAIKLDSPGSIFYMSERYGRNGRKFKMFKFRTMRDGAHGELAALRDKNEVDGPIFKMKNDPRVTKLGAFLRKYSLDELPQLINVILGHMSLVGPRPFPIEQIEKEDLRQLKRLEVRPGITGLWQIRGRSDVKFTKLVKWDIWYINNWSLLLDLSILFQTIPVVCKARGAY